jgi:hypothetical protein
MIVTYIQDAEGEIVMKDIEAIRGEDVTEAVPIPKKGQEGIIQIADKVEIKLGHKIKARKRRNKST